MTARNTFGEIAAITRTVHDDLKARGIELSLPEFFAFVEGLWKTGALLSTRIGWRVDPAKFETALRQLAQSRIDKTWLPS